MYICSKCQMNPVANPGELCMRCRQSSSDNDFSGYQSWNNDDQYENPFKPQDSPGFGEMDMPNDGNSSDIIRRDMDQGGTDVTRANRLDIQIPTLSSGAYEASGIVTNYRESEDPNPPLIRWMKTLLCWIPFRLGKERRTFLLNEGGNFNRTTCIGVEIQGKISSGQLHDNMEVHVSGRKKSNGTVIADRIDILSSNERITSYVSIHPLLAWAVTLAFIAGLLYAFKSIVAFWNENAAMIILALVGIAIIAVLFLLASLSCRAGRGMLKIVLIAGVCVLALLVVKYIPQLIMPIIAVGLCVFLLIKLITG